MNDADRNRFGAILSATMQTYLQPMTADMASVWWGAMARYDLNEVSRALSDHVRDTDVGRFVPKPADIIGRIRVRPEQIVRRLDYKRNAPDFRVLEAIKGLAKPREPREGPWWTPARVVNQAQVDYIVLQAHHGGHMSHAQRFLVECQTAGVITSDNRLGALNVREPGEDLEESEIA